MASPFALLLLLGFLYIVLFGGLSLIRREGLSIRFALEALIITLLFALLSYLGIYDLHPVVFLVIIYLVTMRVRFLVDVGNFFAKRRKFPVAEKIYNFASRIWPDSTNRLILAVNQGALYLQEGNLDKSIITLMDVIKQSDQGYLGVRYESAAHYNLGVAYQRKGNNAHAIAEFNMVLEIWPASVFARAANQALTRLRKAHGQDKGESG